MLQIDAGGETIKVSTDAIEPPGLERFLGSESAEKEAVGAEPFVYSLTRTEHLQEPAS